LLALALSAAAGAAVDAVAVVVAVPSVFAFAFAERVLDDKVAERVHVLQLALTVSVAEGAQRGSWVKFDCIRRNLLKTIFHKRKRLNHFTTFTVARFRVKLALAPYSRSSHIVMWSIFCLSHLSRTCVSEMQPSRAGTSSGLERRGWRQRGLDIESPTCKGRSAAGLKE
jgi:hypothetical protein